MVSILGWEKTMKDGAILDLARSAGFDTPGQFRFSFAAVGVLMATCAVVYSFSKEADDE